MDILKKEILYFLQVAQKGSLTGAANFLEIGQPFLSKVIKKLENEMGSKLFYRGKKGVRLTPSGQNFLDEILPFTREILLHRNRTDSGLDHVYGHYSIGVHPVLAHYTLPQFYCDLVGKNQNLTLDIKFYNSSEVVKKVSEGILNFGLVVNPHSHPDLIIKKLGIERSFLFESRENKNNKIAFYNPEMLKILTNLSKAKKISKNTKFIPIENYHVISEIINSGEGLGVLPEKIASSYDFKKFYAQPLLSANIYLIYRYELSDDKIASNIIKSIEKLRI